MPVDLFPTTERTWLEERLAHGGDGLAEARAHVMARSHAPLVAYVRGARVDALGEPQDIVHDFFARRLAEDEYLSRWLASGLSLRRWLMNGVSAHIRDLWRRRQRDARDRAGISELARETAPLPAASQAFERAWVQATLGEACARVEQALLAGGDAESWRVFAAHVLEGRSYREILRERSEAPTAVEQREAATPEERSALELRRDRGDREALDERGSHRAPADRTDALVDGEQSPRAADGQGGRPAAAAEEERLAVVTRRVLRLLRSEVRAILRADGIPESGLEAEIERMLGGLGE